MAEPLAPAGPLPPGAFLSAAAAGVILCPGDEVQAVGVAAFSGHAEALSARVRDIWGAVLPVTQRRVDSGGIGFTWAGPDRWLVTAPTTTDRPDLEQLLRRHLDGLAAVTDQGDGRVVLRIGGVRARDVLAKLIGIDLHPRRFRTGDVAFTLAAHVPVQLWQLDDAPTYEIAAPRSLAGSLLGALQPAAG